MIKRLNILTLISALVLLSVAARAQSGRGGPEDGGPGDGGPGEPPGFLSATSGLESAKTQIGASDEEWQVIGPKLQAVLFARQAATTTSVASPNGGGRGFGRMGNDSFEGPGAGRRRGGGPPRGGFGDGGPDGPGGGFGGGRRGFGGPGGGPGGFGGGPGGGPGPGGPMGDFGGGNNAVSTALTELATVLADPKAAPDEIKGKVAAVRRARQKAESDLAAAQKDLVLLLTFDQEAMLVALGYLD